MKNDFEFKTLEELYNRIKPALYSKTLELQRNHKDYIKEEDIWNYLTLYDWKVSTNLTLSDMINDILSLEIDKIDAYVLNSLKTNERSILKDEESLL